jgi:hypothetical protein
VLANIGVLGVGLGTSSYPGSIFISDLSITDTGPSSSAFSIALSGGAATTEVDVGATVEVMTNTSGQVRSRLQTSASSTYLFMVTNGWTDSFGRMN